MDEEIKQKLLEQDEKINEIHNMMKGMKRNSQIGLWIGILFFVLPLIGLIIVIPWFLDSYLGALNSI